MKRRLLRVKLIAILRITKPYPPYLARGPVIIVVTLMTLALTPAAASQGCPPDQPNKSTNTKSKQRQMISNPKKECIIPVPPTFPSVVTEVDPWWSARPTVHHDTVKPVFWVIRTDFRKLGVVGLPNCCFKPLTTCIAYCDIWEEVVVVVGYQRVCQEPPERVIRYGTKNVVTQSAMASICGPRRIVQ